MMFVRVNENYIINTDHIIRIRKPESGDENVQVTMSDGKKLTVTYTSTFNHILERMNSK